MIQRRRFKMPVIRITDATWDRLKRWAIPLEDSPEDAVRKVLEAAEEHLKCRQTTGGNHRTETTTRVKGKKLRKGLKTPQQAYRHPILEALYELGGSASVGDVLEVVEKKMKPLLNEVDYQKLPSGVDIRWRNTAMWERFRLVKEGLLKSESPDGIWELSDKGVQEVETKKALKIS
jgi:hypothetical protein